MSSNQFFNSWTMPVFTEHADIILATPGCVLTWGSPDGILVSQAQWTSSPDAGRHCCLKGDQQVARSVVQRRTSIPVQCSRIESCSTTHTISSLSHHSHHDFGDCRNRKVLSSQGNVLDFNHRSLVILQYLTEYCNIWIWTASLTVSGPLLY